MDDQPESSSKPCQQEDPDKCSEAYEASSSVEWAKLGNQAAGRPNTRHAHIHILAGPDWSDGGSSQTQSQTGPVDCSVEVQVVVQQAQSVKPEADEDASQPPTKRKRSRVRCCAISLLVLGLLATGVLVPIAFTVGFSQDITPEFRVLQPPRPSNRLVFAFQSSALAAAARDVLPEHIASQVDGWSALPSSGIHVASFTTAEAMQQALAHLASAGGVPPARHLLQGGSTSSTSTKGTWALKYAVTDFRLLPDRQVTQVMDPMQLFDIAKQQSRTLLEQQQQHGSWLADGGADRRGLSRQPEQQGAGQQQQEQKAGQQQRQQEGQQRRRLASAAQQQQELELLPSMVRYFAGATSPAAAGAAALQQAAHPASGDPSSSPAWVSLRRNLLQAASMAVPRRGRPQLQVQQRQAQQQVQRGGSKVAWHLADTGLGVRNAWNITSGLDRVIVAVIDSGVELASSGVGAAVWANAAEVAGDGIDNDGNGYTDDAMGWDFGGGCGDLMCSFCAPGPDPTDAVGWGTHAAAAVAAQPEVASGTSGIAPGVRVMPLKVADCRHGTQLWDVATQQGGLVKDLDSSTGGTLPQGQTQQGPALLGSAAVQALDYALLNGAHIVLAGWTAGDLLGGSSSTGRCYLGADAAAQAGLDAAAAAAGGAGCVAAVQQQLFLDALKPLQQAGVLVVTMQDSSTSTSSPPLPCSLSCDLDNVVCVSASATVLPPTDTTAGRTNVASTSEFFSPLVSQHSSSYYDWLDPADLEEEWKGMGAAGQGASSASANPPAAARDPDAAASSVRLEALSCTSRSGTSSRSGNWAQLGAPGQDILAGWAWGSHAVLSGSSAAASVTAGVAALAWSKLGQTLGADASAEAFEGLGQLVKQQLLQGSTARSSSSGGDGAAAGTTDGSSAGAAAGTTDSSSMDAFVPLGVASSSGSIPKRSSLMGSSSSSSADDPAGPPLDLDLFGTLLQSSKAPEVVTLQPEVLSTSITTAVKALRYSWHIQGDESGPYDTNSMWYVGRKAIKPQAFPITRWEFYGATSLVEIAGYLDISTPGSYEFGVSSEDRFVVWLQDWSLHMQEAGPGEGLAPGWWRQRVNFAAPGLYKLRIIVYAPSKPFDLQWRPPGSSSFSRISSLVSIGQTQPLPQQLLHSMLLPLATREGSSSERSNARPPAAPASNTQNKPAGSGSNSGGGEGQTYVASSSSSVPSAQPAPLPLAPAGDADAGGSDVAATGVTSSAARPTGTSVRGVGGAPAAPGSDWEGVLQEEADASSMLASMEPAASEGNEPMLAADAEDYSPLLGTSTSSSSTPGASYMGGAGQQMGYHYEPATGAADNAPSAVGGGDDFWSQLRGIFGGGWFGRRRLASLGESYRQPLMLGSSAMTAPSTAPRQPQQQQRRLAAADGARAGPVPRRVQEVAGQGSTGAVGSHQQLGRFSLALAFAPRTQYRTLMPDQTKTIFTHTGVLPGPGLNIGGWLQVQESVLGWNDPKDNRGAYGMIQGWLDWRELNPTAAAAISRQQAAARADSPAGAGSPARPGSVAVEGTGLGASLGGGGMSVGAAGVQFELSCDSCSLQIDGTTVVGSMGGVETSTCVVPAAVAQVSAGGSSSAAAGQRHAHLLHLHMLFTTNDNRNAKFNVRVRPCTGINSQAGAGAWAPLSAASASPPVFAVPSAAVSGAWQQISTQQQEVYARGMLCAVRAQPPAAAPVAAGDASAPAAAADSTSDGGALQRVVFLSAERMQQAISIPAEATADVAAMPAPPPSDDSLKSSSNSPLASPSTNSGNSNITVDAPAGAGFEEDGTPINKEAPAQQRASSDGSSDGSMAVNATSSGNATADALAAAAAARAAAEARARKEQAQRRAAQTAAAKAAALARGVGVSDLVPDWVATLPADTRYSFSCGCYWNGSWEGNVSVAVKAGGSSGSSAGGILAAGSSGHTRMFLAGWLVAAQSGQVLGPSDLDVRGYSTLMQRQQLAAGSDSADPLVDASHDWASGLGLYDAGAVPSSSSGSSMVSRDSGLAAGSESKQALSAEGVRRRRHSRVQQQAVSRTSGGSSASGGSGSSSVLGLQPLGVLDGVSRRVIMPLAGQHQLLVLQAEGLAGDAQLVVLAPGDTSSNSSSSSLLAANGSGGGSSGNSSIVSSWLPSAWDAWVPAG